MARWVSPALICTCITSGSASQGAVHGSCGSSEPPRGLVQLVLTCDLLLQHQRHFRDAKQLILKPPYPYGLKQTNKQNSSDKSRQHIKKQRHHFVDKGPYTQSYSFSSSHVQMWELDHKEGWTPRNWCFQTVVLEKILESPLDSKEIKPVNPKGNKPWILTGRTSAEPEAPIL